MSVIEKKEGGLIFINAPGSTGKTFLMNLILAEIRLKGDIALAVASSGVAGCCNFIRRRSHSAFSVKIAFEFEFSRTTLL